jgi:hypothetical protein
MLTVPTAAPAANCARHRLYAGDDDAPDSDVVARASAPTTPPAGLAPLNLDLLGCELNNAAAALHEPLGVTHPVITALVSYSERCWRESERRIASARAGGGQPPQPPPAPPSPQVAGKRLDLALASAKLYTLASSIEAEHNLRGEASQLVELAEQLGAEEDRRTAKRQCGASDARNED